MPWRLSTSMPRIRPSSLTAMRAADSGLARVDAITSSAPRCGPQQAPGWPLNQLCCPRTAASSGCDNASLEAEAAADIGSGSRWTLAIRQRQQSPPDEAGADAASGVQTCAVKRAGRGIEVCDPGQRGSGVDAGVAREKSSSSSATTSAAVTERRLDVARAASSGLPHSIGRQRNVDRRRVFERPRQIP